MVSLINFRSVNELNTVGNHPTDSLVGFDPQPNGKKKYQLQSLQPAALLDQKPIAKSNEHFEVRWSDLSYQVEPKWYKQQWQSLMSPGSKSQAPTKTTILNRLSGSFKSGQVTAILGPSGAGKTSLLGCLTGKHRAGVTGCIQVLSTRAEPLSTCTIPQKDYLLNQLTVRENLWFASRLKHPEPLFDHDSNIDRVLELLKLESCIDTKISKISGGQYKRVSIAQELLSSPDILILDEPTSGLDSLTCYKTVMVLRDLARKSVNPMAIIVTIHQPQREVFELFNHVYILAVGGRSIYEGHPTLSIKTINEQSGGLHFEADQYNPASYLVEIASGEFGQKPIEALVEHQTHDFKRRCREQSDSEVGLQGTPGLKKRASPMIARFKSTFGSAGHQKSAASPPPSPQAQHAQFAYTNRAYESSPAHQLAPKQQQLQLTLGPHQLAGHQQELEPGAAPEHRLIDYRLQMHKHNHQGHFLRHCQLLTKRSWLCLCKDPMLTTLRFSAHIIVPLLITLVYGSRVGKPNACPLYETNMDLIDYAKQGPQRLMNLQDELRSTFENVGLYFLSIYAFTFSTMCLTSLSFPLSMHVLLKEVRNGWYSIPTYFIGKTLADFPLEFILPTVTLMITYPLTGQPSSFLEWRFLLATAIFVITSLIAQTQGLIFGALFMNAMQAAVFVAPVSTTPLILLSGFLIRISQMPVYLQKLSSLSYFRYAIESLTIVRYGFGQCFCNKTLVTGEPVNPVGIPNQLREFTRYWLSTFDDPEATTLLPETTSLVFNGTQLENPAQPDFFQDLAELLARANSFGTEIRNCDNFKPYPMIDFSLHESQLYVWLLALIGTLIISKIVNYLVVEYSVKFRL